MSAGAQAPCGLALERLAGCGTGLLELSWSSARDGLGVLAAPEAWEQVAGVAEALPRWSDLAPWLRAAWDEGHRDFLRLDLADDRIAAVTVYGRTLAAHAVLTFPPYGAARRLRPDGREAQAGYYDVRHLAGTRVADDLAAAAGELDAGFDRALFLEFAGCGWLQLVALHADSPPSYIIAGPDRRRLARLAGRLAIDPGPERHRAMLGYAALRFGAAPMLRCYARPQRFATPGVTIAGLARC
ncbi:hypothetical protein U1839_20780 [Sphingomonas sp. RT2P30]|uniref:hypothetical protein n=1 Tax=Parasphingomonas halimpatiens TaxID=3096162 RepID=UPI002FCB08CB